MAEGEGSAQVGEVVAVWSIIIKEAGAKEPVFIYMDSYTVLMGGNPEHSQMEIFFSRMDRCAPDRRPSSLPFE